MGHFPIKNVICLVLDNFLSSEWCDFVIMVGDIWTAIITVVDITRRLTRDRSARDARQCPVSDVLSVSSRFTSLLSPNFCQSLSRETGMLMLIIMLTVHYAIRADIFGRGGLSRTKWVSKFLFL